MSRVFSGLPRSSAGVTTCRFGELLDGLLERGYVSVSFEEFDSHRAHVILRHDLCMSLAPSLEVAEIEAVKGLRATYFVRMRGEFYNPLTASTLEGLSRLLDLGHALGVHVDVTEASTASSLEQAVRDDAALLGRLVGTTVRDFSWHRPAAYPDLPRGMEVAGMRNAYGDDVFGPGRYCSDSRGDWHHGHPFDLAAVRQGLGFQLLTHPIWWTARDGEDPRARLDRLAADRSDAFRRALAADSSVYDYP